ncbi:hypothetical protein, partial [Desulfobaculum sp.]
SGKKQGQKAQNDENAAHYCPLLKGERGTAVSEGRRQRDEGRGRVPASTMTKPRPEGKAQARPRAKSRAQQALAGYGKLLGAELARRGAPL